MTNLCTQTTEMSQPIDQRNNALIFPPHLAGRFLYLSGEAKTLADIAWVPFGRGARNCIGFAPPRCS